MSDIEDTGTANQVSEKAVVKGSVFLSYARADDTSDYNDPEKSFMLRLYTYLTDKGFQVWWDRQNMPNRGLTFMKEISDAIDKVDRLILVVGPGAVESEYVRQEWEYALSICKVVTPILRHGDYDLVPDPLKDDHCEDCRETRNEEEAFAAVASIIDDSPLPLSELWDVPNLPPNYMPRAKDLSRIRQIVRENVDKPVMVTGTRQRSSLQGMGGIGKTVLAAALARDCSIRRSFPDGIYWVTLGQEPRLTQLQAQLGERMGDNPRSFGNVDDGRRRLSTLMKDRRSLFILDDAWKADHIHAFDVMGDHCRMLITTRMQNIVTEMGAVAHRVEVLDPSDAMKFLSEWSNQAVEDMPPEAAQVARECGYLPLALAMIGALLGERSNRWERALHRLKAADLKNLRRDFPDYPYPDMLRAIEVSVQSLSPELQTRYFDLAVFPEDVDIPEAALKTFWAPEGYDKFAVEDIIDEFKNRSLVKINEDSTLHLHDLLVDYVQKRAGDLTRLHERLLAAYNPENKPWPQVEDDGYLYYHLAQHLTFLGRSQELFELLTASPDWLKAKFTACRGDSAFADDVDLLLRDYQKPDLQTELVPLVQLYTVKQLVNHRIGRYNNNMIAALVWIDRKDEALSHVQLREDLGKRFDGLMTIFRSSYKKDQTHLDILSEIKAVIAAMIYPQQKVQAYLDLSQTLSDCEHQAEAAEVLQIASSLISAIPSVLSQVKVSIQLARQYQELNCEDIALNLLNHNLQVAQLIEDAYMRVSALSELAVTLRQAGEIDKSKRVFEQAEEVVQTIEDTSSRGEALSDLAAVLAQADETDESNRVFEQAEEVAQSIESAFMRASALRDLAVALAQAGRYEQAEEVAQSIESASMRGAALNALAVALAQAGRYEQAEEVAQSIEDAYMRVSALSDLARTLMQAGETEESERVFAQVEEVAQSIEDASWRGSTLRDLAAALAQAGRYEQAEEMAQSIEDAFMRASALRDLAVALAQVGRYEQAEEMAQSIESAYSRGSALSDLAAVLAQVGRYEQAEEMAQSIESAYSRGSALSDLAAVLAQAGEIDESERVFEQAEEVAQSIEDASWREYALRDLAVALAQAGRYEQAEEVAESIEDAASRGLALRALAAALTQAGETDKSKHVFEQAEEVAQTIEDTISRESALRDLAVALAQAGRYEQAEEVVQSTKFVSSREYALSDLALALAQAGETDESNRLFEQAEEVAQSIEDADSRVYALSDLARTLMQAGETEESERVFAQVEKVLQSIEDADSRGTALRALVVTLVWAGHYEQAEEVAESIEEAFSRGTALSDLAVALAQVGRYEQAEEVAESIEEAFNRMYALSALAASLAQVGRYEQAEEVAESIEEASWRGDALRALAAALARAGKVDPSLRVLVSRQLEAYIGFLAGSFEGLRVIFGQEVAYPHYVEMLVAAMKIAAWEQPRWNEVVEILETS
ncbi:tetratricopeptide repeat protein [Phototrophicus methaneseepsis]|uniref:Tetratricopeptide repeat protein n=1 Tax=Phototrophicus methaneseepsis TaxID=2710758 RepID=A0A7S8EB97_9CHLR|nr:tetratricopeptide repeat protein [Phototrophicus methaneseepsis]QPC83762.1 tetratricopeptide repeat protein [Phototrophicus methaneseepsis]